MNTRPRWICQLVCGGWFLIALACCPSPAARADEASKVAIINELFEVLHVDTQLQPTVRLSVDAQRSQFEQIEPFKSNKAAVDELLARITTTLNAKLDWEKLKPAMVKLYADIYTEDELAAFLAFYKSPAGQAMLTRSSAVTAGMTRIVVQQMEGLKPDINRIVQDALTKYQRPKNTLDDH